MHLLVSTPENIAYLTGYLTTDKDIETLLVGNFSSMGELQSAWHIVPSMVLEEVKRAAHNKKVKIVELAAGERFSQKILELDFKDELFFEAEHLPYGIAIGLRKKFVEEAVKFKSLSTDKNPLNRLRLRKTSEEIVKMKLSAKAAIESYNSWRQKLKVGVTELEARINFQTELAKRGATEAFPTIVAFGKNSALPHHNPDTTTLKQNSIVLIDFGAAINNYLSDHTVTFWWGEKPSAEFIKTRDLVEQAYELAVELLPKVKTFSKVHQEVVGLFKEEAKHLTHSLGHGIGIGVHEAPFWPREGTEELQPCNVITIEPGLYYPEWGGVRLENTYYFNGSTLEELYKLEF